LRDVVRIVDGNGDAIEVSELLFVEAERWGPDFKSLALLVDPAPVLI
jgi:hypothetical protein